MSAVRELREVNELLKVTQYISIGVRSSTQTLLFKICFSFSGRQCLFFFFPPAIQEFKEF